MSSVQEMFHRIQDNKKKRKDIRSLYSDTLANEKGYREATEELKTLREKKKRIELKVKMEFENELRKIDDINAEMKSDMGAIADAVLAQIAQGKIVKVRDAYNNSYDPVIKVSFKKSDEEGGD